MTDPARNMTWTGKICDSCRSTFEYSPTNCVSVQKFSYCPICGDSELIEREMPLDEYLQHGGQNDEQ